MRQRKRGVVRWREDIEKYIIDYYDNLGKRHKEAVGTNEHDAYRELAKKIEEIDTGSYDPLPKTETFKAFAERWLKGKIGIKGATRVSYQGILDNHLVPYFGKGRIIELRRKNIQEFVRSKIDDGSLSPKTMENVLRVLHQILDDAEVEGLIMRNPYLKIERPRRERPVVDYLRTHEIPVFLEAARTLKEPKEKTTRLPLRSDKKKEKPKCETTIHTLFYMAIFSGMRRGELLGLKWEDVDWVNSKIHVRRSLYKGAFQSPKSEYSKRVIDMGPRLTETLKAHRKKQNETRLKVGADWMNHGLVFCQNDGNVLDGDNLYHRDFKAILKKAGLRSIRIHDLRHTHAAILISAGHNLKYIQNQMGHSSIQVTMDLYGHIMPEVHEGAAKRTEDFVYCPATVPEQKEGVTACAVTP